MQSDAAASFQPRTRHMPAWEAPPMSTRSAKTLFKHFERTDGRPAFGLVIADEAHMMRGRGALMNAMLWLSSNSSAVLAMTATPGYTSPQVSHSILTVAVKVLLSLPIGLCYDRSLSRH